MQPQTYQKAWSFAAQKHANQTMPDNPLPYLVHLGNVSFEILLAAAKSPELDIEFALQMAIFHDVIEDTSCSYDELANTFGSRIADGVLALTKDETLPKEEQMKDSIQRILLLEKEVAAVKMADRITNLQPPRPTWSKEEIKNYHTEAIFIWENLKDGNQFLADRLAIEIERYVRYF